MIELSQKYDVFIETYKTREIYFNRYYAHFFTPYIDESRTCATLEECYRVIDRKISADMHTGEGDPERYKKGRAQITAIMYKQDTDVQKFLEKEMDHGREIIMEVLKRIEVKVHELYDKARREREVTADLDLSEGPYIHINGAYEIPGDRKRTAKEAAEDDDDREGNRGS